MRNLKTPGALALVAGWILAALTSAADPLAPEFLARLPADLKDPAARWLTVEARKQKSWAGAPDSTLREQVVLALAATPAAAAFVLSDLPKEPDRLQFEILGHIQSDPFWTEDPNVDSVLETLVKTAPDIGVVQAAGRGLRTLAAKRVRAVIAARLKEARAAHDADAEADLADTDETWMVREKESLLPTYLRVVPPVFAALPPKDTLRMVGFGDFGTGTEAQHRVAAAILTLHHTKPFDLGLALGDNFYPDGSHSPTDPRWRDWWEAIYGPLGIHFYAVLGNHDWYSPDSPAAEILYSAQSPTWRMPAPYYTFTAGPVQFFALDTSDISEAQLLWLRQALAASTSRWKVAFGHHPVYAPTTPGAERTSYMRERLWPVVDGKIDAYLCGHQHAIGRMEAVDGVHFIMAGGGGAPLAAVVKTPGTQFAEETYGFMTLEADPHTLMLSTFDAKGTRLDGETVQKN